MKSENVDIVLGEILIAKIRSVYGGYVVDAPGTVMRHYGHEHVLKWNVYALQSDAIAAAYRLVPNSCRSDLKVMFSSGTVANITK